MMKVYVHLYVSILATQLHDYVVSVTCIFISKYDMYFNYTSIYLSMQAVYIPGSSVVVLSWKWVELCLNDKRLVSHDEFVR